MRRTLGRLTTRRLDGRSAVAVAVRRWTEDVRRDLGGDLTCAQGTILEAAAQAWIILTSLDDYIARQPTLVTKKRQVLPIVMQRMQIAESLARHLERLGLERRLRYGVLVEDNTVERESDRMKPPIRERAEWLSRVVSPTRRTFEKLNAGR